MKIFAAGVILVLAFLVTDESFAGPEHCTGDFWGNCQETHRYRHHHHPHYRHCVKDYWGRCNDGHPRWRHRPHHYPVHPSRGEGDRGVICHPRRRVVGDERADQDKARRTAEISWMGAVRYDYGERYQDLKHAKDIRTNCDPSTVPSRGLAKVFKSVQYRCAVEATPCRAPTGASEDRAERRIEIENDD